MKTLLALACVPRLLVLRCSGERPRDESDRPAAEAGAFAHHQAPAIGRDAFQCHGKAHRT